MIVEALFIILILITAKLWADLITGEAIFMPLPKNTIRKILKAGKVKKNDLLVDLGSGDGRVLIIAAKEFKARAIGIEKNIILAKIAERNIKKENLESEVKVINKDFFDVNLKKLKPSVIFAYLSKKVNEKLEPKLKKELKKGTRVLSASHQFKTLKLVKKIKTGHFYSYVYTV